MNIEVGSRVRALRDSEMSEFHKRPFFWKGDVGVVKWDNDGGFWVQWDGNELADGVWWACPSNLEVVSG